MQGEYYKQSQVSKVLGKKTLSFRPSNSLLFPLEPNLHPCSVLLLLTAAAATTGENLHRSSDFFSLAQSSVLCSGSGSALAKQLGICVCVHATTPKSCDIAHSKRNPEREKGGKLICMRVGKWALGERERNYYGAETEARDFFPPPPPPLNGQERGNSSVLGV